MKTFICRLILSAIISMVLSCASINLCDKLTSAYCGIDLNQTICVLRHVKRDFGPPESTAIEYVKTLVMSLSITIGVLNFALVLNSYKK